MDILSELADELQYCSSSDGMNFNKMKDYIIENNKTHVTTRTLLLPAREEGM